MAVKGSARPGHKYISRKKVKGEWIYKYAEPKKKVVIKKKGEKKVVIKKEKLKIKDYYGEDRNKYFKTGKEKKEFLKKQKLGFAGGKGQKIVTSQRIKIGTNVSFRFGEEKYTGQVIATDGTVTESPKHFDIQFTAQGKTYVRKGVPKERVTRKEKSWAQQQKEKTQKKTKELQGESRAMEIRAVSDNIKIQAQELVRANWDIFEKVTGKYYDTRVKGGWDARKFGFEQDDLKMEAALIVMKAAQSFLTNKPKDKRATFKSYVLSFLKADLASALAVGSGAGGHLKASPKNQMYLWFFKDTLDEYKEKHKGAIPSDVEMLDFLENKRKKLENVKGNRTFISYQWTPEKVRNAKRQSKKMESLQGLVENPKSGTAATMLSILNDEEIETFGHYRIDPWVEVQKIVVKDGVKDSISRIFKTRSDKEIIIRKFGLFIDEDSPPSLRRYAQGWTSGEVADYLTKEERRKGSRKSWTATNVDERERQLFEKLRGDERFEKEMKDFVKSENKSDKEWGDVSLVIYWITMYQIMERVVTEFFPLFLEEPKTEELEGGKTPDYKIGFNKKK